MYTEKTIVTPKLASEILEKNTSNREVRKNKVDLYCEKIENGEWILTHQGIGIAEDGTLIDGQHRLMAIVKANISVEMLVSRNVSKETYTKIDDGIIRSLGDKLNISTRAATVIGTASKLYSRWSGKAEFESIKKINSLLLNPTLELFEKEPGGAKYFSTAPVVLAAVYSKISKPADAKYIENMYSNLVKGNLGELTYIGQDYFSQVARGITKSENFQDRYTRACFVFNKENEDKNIRMSEKAKADAYDLHKLVMSRII